VYDTLVLDKKTVLPGTKKAKECMNADRRALLRSIKVLFFNQAEVEYYSKLASVDLNTINYYIILITTPLKHFAALDYFHDIIKYLNLCYCGG